MDKYKPIRKVSAGSTSGAIVYLILFVLSYFDVQPTTELATALPVVVGFVVAYMVPAQKIVKKK